MTTQQDIARLLNEVGTSPRLYAHELDLVRQGVLLLDFAEDDYRRASFLDQRALTPSTTGAWFGLDQLASALNASARPAPPPHFIFHMGHTGSTLLSRLLDATGVTLGLREPMPLRTLAEVHDNIDQPTSLVSPVQLEQLAKLFLTMWSRRFAGSGVPVVKATSHTARVAPLLSRVAPDLKSVSLTMQPTRYMAVILAGAGAMADLRGFAAERMGRVIDHMGTGGAALAPLHSLGPGEMAAMTWLAERLSQDTLLAQGDAALELDFDHILKAPAESLGRVCDHFGLEVPPGRVDGAVAGPVMRQYSKAADHAYSADLREQVIAESFSRNGDVIAQGTAWLKALASDNAAVEAALAGRDL